MNETLTEVVPVSAWDWMLHSIFARCVDPDAIRYDLSRPFVIDEYVYATNARIAVRMPTPDGWTIPNPDRKIPREVVGMFAGDHWEVDPVQFPPVEGTCVVCHGARVLPEITCPWCHAESPGPYEAGFCDECWQLEGKIPAGSCYDCGGSGVLDAGGRIEVVPGYWLQRKWVAMLHEFAMTTYLPRKFYDKVGRETVGRVTRFTLGDVTGVLMPMTPPGRDRRRRA